MHCSWMTPTQQRLSAFAWRWRRAYQPAIGWCAAECPLKGSGQGSTMLTGIGRPALG